jgi:osmotically-inducible protein OsmY
MKSATKLALLFSILIFGSQTYAQTDMNSPTTPAPADIAIVKNIQGNIAKDNTLKGFNITPSSQQGIVTLDGTVDTQAQADAAVNDIKKVSGIKSVKSNIIVKRMTSSTTNY